MKVIKNYLLYTATISGEKQEIRNGLWYVDLTTKDRYLVLPSNYNYYGTNFGAIFPTSSKILLEQIIYKVQLMKLENFLKQGEAHISSYTIQTTLKHYN